ncbi:MAG: hypothetical protein LBV79_09670 [Candidatus Adiutrix sp.]|jgi:hypothetical protein|nr:hypothetical protein [Candidatus Adiutrix sp.]
MLDTKIFEQNLSVTAVSAYIIVAALTSESREPALSAIRSRWHAPPLELEKSLAELLGWKVVARDPASGEADPVFRLNPSSAWGPRQPWPAPKGLPVFPGKPQNP